MRALKLGLSIALSGMLVGCVAAPIPKVQPPGGYEAIRFRSTVSLIDHSTNTYTFAAGSTLVSDRVSDAGQVYCGTFAVNEGTATGCIGFDGSNVVLGPENTLKRVVRPVTPGLIEQIRMPL